MIDQTLSHYRITAKLGEGGMGEVYRAHDERLDRDVAIKVLPEAVAQDADRLARFEREAKAVARLSHPNILEIHELGEHAGRPFMVTELLEGETLRERLDGGPFGWRKATEIGAAIADGLAATHQAEIIHRDLKSSNVLLSSDGRVKVLDFGLARYQPTEAGEGETAVATMTRQTDPGTVLGTVGYMSPEQVRGQEVDHRSDVFALGCVLYEMVSGQGPFRRDEVADCMAAILRDDPSPLTVDAPEALDRIVLRCLEKNPGERFQSAAEVGVALTTLLTATHGILPAPQPEAASIAVLPFANLSPDPDQEYFSDGLTEEVIADLAQVGSLRVISSTSVMQLKGTSKDLRTIGRELNTRYVLEGSVRRAGNALRITAQLIDADTDTHLWARKYTGTLDDIFDIQEKVSRSIVDALSVKLSPEESRKIAERPIEDIHAYECYTRARQEIWRGTEDSQTRAVRLIERGLEIAGDNEALYALLGLTYVQYVNFLVDTDESYMTRAEECVERIGRLDPDSPYLDQLKGFIHFKRGNMQLAVRHYKDFLRASPNDPLVLLSLSYLYVYSGQKLAAAPLIERLLEIDPLTPWNYWSRGAMELLDARPQAALLDFQRIYEMDPTDPVHRVIYGLGLAYNDRPDEARSILGPISVETPDTIWASMGSFFEQALQGNAEEAAGAVTPDLEIAAKGDEWVPLWMAECYALIGAKDQALKWVEQAIDNGFICYPYLSEIDPLLQNIRGEERFLQLMDRVKHEWETFEV